MTYPIRNPWWSRPAWSEWRDWRNGGWNHDGLDMYTRRGTAIYATGNGVVVRKGYHRPAPRVGHGHFIAIQYGNVEVSYSHMLAASPYAIGARVDKDTRVGQVGDTGSAEGVDWDVGSPTGQPLQHVHVEVRLFGTLINPRIHFDSLALAGGGTEPIDMPLTQAEINAIAAESARQVLSVFQIAHHNVQGSTNLATHVSRTRASVGDVLAVATDTRDTANATKQLLENLVAQLTPTQIAQAVWATELNHAGQSQTKAPAGTHLTFGRRDASRAATAAEQAIADIANIPAGEGGSGATNLQPLLEAIEKVPTAQQNGEAARAAIVK